MFSLESKNRKQCFKISNNFLFSFLKLIHIVESYIIMKTETHSTETCLLKLVPSLFFCWTPTVADCFLPCHSLSSPRQPAEEQDTETTHFIGVGMRWTREKTLQLPIRWGGSFLLSRRERSPSRFQIQLLFSMQWSHFDHF